MPRHPGAPTLRQRGVCTAQSLSPLRTDKPLWHDSCVATSHRPHLIKNTGRMGTFRAMVRAAAALWSLT
jgi:hypothetical protein